MSRTAGRASATIADVAQLAGVSVATVSRALRGFDNVSPTTAERVIAAAQELDYTSNLNAAMLRSGTSRAISVVVPTLSNWYNSEIMAGVEAVLSDAGYDTLVSVASDEDAFERIVASLQPARARVDGLIVVEQVVRPASVEALRSWNCPSVVVGQLVDGMDSVAIDDFEVGATAARHLVDHGHTKIGLIEGIGHRIDTTSAQSMRRSGFLHAMEKAGLPVSDQCRAANEYTVAGGMRSIAELYAQANPPTAVFCMSDLIALGAMRTLEDLGFRVPDDVSIVGVDDHEISRLMGITTVHQPVGELGAEAARLLLEQLNGDRSQMVDLILPTELRDRRTTRALAAA